VSLIDWGVVNRTLISFRPSESVLSERKEIAAYIGAETGYFRTYSPSYSLPQHIAVLHDLELADGVDPMQLSSYSGYMIQATGIPQLEYSVTLPPFANGNPSQDNAGFIPDPNLLAHLNVEYVISDFKLNLPELKLQQVFSTTRVYENIAAYPRAWIQNTPELTAKEIKPVMTIDWTPNRITIRASGPGHLTLSEIWYPGWHVVVDGKPGTIEKVFGLLRGVELEPGEHDIEFVFRPISLFAGLVLCFLGLFLWYGIYAKNTLHA
jgi:hypothetical protein